MLWRGGAPFAAEYYRRILFRSVFLISKSSSSVPSFPHHHILVYVPVNELFSLCIIWWREDSSYVTREGTLCIKPRSTLCSHFAVISHYIPEEHYISSFEDNSYHISRDICDSFYVTLNQKLCCVQNWYCGLTFI